MNVLVTAGPTREPLDPVRFISNRSSGKMGYALAAAARARGHQVWLVSGPVAISPPSGVRLIRVETAAEMLAAARRIAPRCTLIIMAAAVADWRVKHPAKRKRKKSAGPPRVQWEPTPDILQILARDKRPGQVICGFAAETTPQVAREARRKLREKSLDAIAVNNVAAPGIGFESDFNALTVFRPAGAPHILPRARKSVCARRLLALLEKIVAAKKIQKKVDAVNNFS